MNLQALTKFTFYPVRPASYASHFTNERYTWQHVTVSVLTRLRDVDLNIYREFRIIRDMATTKSIIGSGVFFSFS